MSNLKKNGPGASDSRVEWVGENSLKLCAVFGLDGSVPVVRELSYNLDGKWVTLAEGMIPEFEVTTGIRRKDMKCGGSEELKWWCFNDEPLGHRDEVKYAEAEFTGNVFEVRKNGVRTEIVYPGVNMGQFSGELQFTIFSGSNLLRVEMVAKTEDQSVAYIYRGGLAGVPAQRLYWLDLLNNPQYLSGNTVICERPERVIARNRVLTAEGENGSLAAFPPPHSFFFPRQLENNVGYAYRRREGEKLAIGVRMNEESEYYHPWAKWPLYSAKPGTVQRMQAYFYISPGKAEECRAGAMAYTNNDTYKPIEGYKTMVNHFHMGFWEEYKNDGETVFPWIKLFRQMGVDIAYLNDFHGKDGHPKDTGLVRLEEMKYYFEACRHHSDDKFLILPSEEPNYHVGGHWDVLFPRPVYYTNLREADQPFVEEIEPYGRVYHLGSMEDVYNILKLEDGLGWTTHPRTKSSNDCPEIYKDTELFKSKYWMGCSFKYLPGDLSFKRLPDERCFEVLDEMNNWGGPKYMIGEVDTYKKSIDYDLYGDFNVNYVKLDKLPGAEDWSPLNEALAAGEFFVSTGEVLIKKCEILGNEVIADVEWTFPLEFVEVVWGDGKETGRNIIPTTELQPFGSKEFRIPFPEGVKWVRFSAWDCAVNGAFTQPVHL